jgi:vacuolar-type H+-ATPase subunit E/Vma4
MDKGITFSEQYPELDKIAKVITLETAKRINDAARGIESKMPYKAQAILEEVIKNLQAMV